MAPPIITLMTDFGLADPFVGIMKGVMAGIAREAAVIDLCHGVEPFDLRGPAFLIGGAYPYFPKGTIHVVVVDPGVGGPRRPILVSADGHHFIGPDNGVLTAALAKAEGVRELTADRYFLHPVSASFHGRDIFAPVAAHLARGVAPAEFGSSLRDPVRLDLPVPVREGDHRLVGEVVWVERFGNLVTNISAGDLEALRAGRPLSAFGIVVGRRRAGLLWRYYGEAGPRGMGGLVGSWGALEVFVNQGNAAKALRAKRGTRVAVAYLRGRR